MASRRVTKSAINWTALAEKVPARQKDAFRVMKSNSDKFVNKVSGLPEALPKIDFSEYRRRITNTAMVAEFEKLYDTVEVPYPKDPSNLKVNIDGEAKLALQQKDVYLAELNVTMKGINELLATIDSVPAPEKMTMQMFNHYFPNAAVNPNRKNPGFFPQSEASVQPDREEFGPEYYNHLWDNRGIASIKQWEEEHRMKVEQVKHDKQQQLAAAEKKDKVSQSQ